MKRNKIILITTTLVLMFVTIITDFILREQFVLQNTEYFEINMYTNNKYVLSDSEKQILCDRLKNNVFFDKYEKNIEQYVEIKLNKDEKDGKAWGTLSLFLDKNIENELKVMLQQTNEKVSTDSRIYGIIDNYGSIYIEEDYMYNNKIKLVFTVNLPYKYNSKEDYDEFIKFFLKFNN